jgi:hypothetical protein
MEFGEQSDEGRNNTLRIEFEEMVRLLHIRKLFFA